MLSGLDGSMAAVSGWLDATASHIADSGIQTSARGSTVDCSGVEPSAATTTLGSLATTFAPMHFPSRSGPPAVYSAASRDIRPYSPSDTATVTKRGAPSQCASRGP
jgi:hypothetical protein